MLLTRYVISLWGTSLSYLALVWTENYTIITFILLPLFLWLIEAGTENEGQPMTKTTVIDICTSYSNHIQLALRIYLGG